MSVILATTWSPSFSLYSGWLTVVAAISASACFIASLRQLRRAVLGQLLVIVGAPILFFTVLFSECGMFLLKDGRDFGFPIWARAYPNASDFLATYIALGACYLIAREASRMPSRAVRIIGWVESVCFASFAAFELFLLSRRIYVG